MIGMNCQKKNAPAFEASKVKIVLPAYLRKIKTTHITLCKRVKVTAPMKNGNFRHAGCQLGLEKVFRLMSPVDAGSN